MAGFKCLSWSPPVFFLGKCKQEASCSVPLGSTYLLPHNYSLLVMLVEDNQIKDLKQPLLFILCPLCFSDSFLLWTYIIYTNDTTHLKYSSVPDFCWWIKKANLFLLTFSKPPFKLYLQLCLDVRTEYHQIFTLPLRRLFYQWTKHSPSALPVRKLSKKSHSYLLFGKKIDRSFLKNAILVSINNFKNVF